MNIVGRILPLIFVPLLMAGCGEGITRQAALAPDSQPRKQVALKNEWRMGWRVPTQGPAMVRIDVPPASHAALRLGILPVGGALKAAEVRVYRETASKGPQRLATLNVEPGNTWVDQRVDLGSSDSPRTINVDLQEARGMWVSHCEIVGAGPQPANVLVVLVDTLRKDHVGAYGYTRDTSPNIDALAKEAILFRDLMPHSSWTRPSVASLFTSVYPEIHGAQDRPDVLRDGLPTLAGAFAKGGYESIGLITNIHLLPLWGFDRGFARYIDVDSANWRAADDRKAVDRAIGAIKDAAGRPWFMYLHLMGPHDPYTPPAPYNAKFGPAAPADDSETAMHQHAIDQYDGEIAYTDEHIGRLWTALREMNLYDGALIVLLADHGEEFWEHGGQFHTRTLYEEMLGVPLIVKLPGSLHAGELREGAVEMIDVAPTLLDLAGAGPEPAFHGTSFRDIIGDPAAAGRIGYASLTYDALSLRAAKQSGQKYIRDVGGGAELWFDLLADPGERRPLGPDVPLAPALARHVNRIATRGAAGFHLVITCGDGAGHTIVGAVSGEGLGDYAFRYYEWKSEAQRDGNTVRFSMRTKHPQDAATSREEWHTKFAEQDNAQLFVQAPIDKPITVRIDVDGQPLTVDLGFSGNAQQATPLDSATLNPVEILANPNRFDPAALPRRFAVYAFYVAEPGSIALDRLDPEVVDAMEALGYLD